MNIIDLSSILSFLSIKKNAEFNQVSIILTLPYMCLTVSLFKKKKIHYDFLLPKIEIVK